MRAPEAHRSRIVLVSCLLGFSLLGCSGPCEELLDVCGLCRDPNQRARCVRSVEEDPDEVCEQNIDAYRGICE
ncbi:MAG: hypothetical protein AAGA56_18505 [Myxococcota bacterium]